ncbi:MAG: inositol monophosphatase [Myxococcales bacterium]|nr:inositol monophosphatase [Myxococcales bacterium]
MSEIACRVQFAREIAVNAGKLLKGEFGKSILYERKTSVIDLVTQVDRMSERYLVDRIEAAFPSDMVVTEESGVVQSGGNGFSWVVDPLDGTTNFVHSFPHFAVSIGILSGGTPAGAVIYAPIANELFHAETGCGAFLNNQRIHVSQTSALSEALLATGFPYNRRAIIDELLIYIRRAVLSAHGIRRCGSAALDLCSVAAGRVDGFWEQGLKPWDLAAGVLIVTESGGTITDFDGGNHDMNAGRTVASNKLIHGELLRTVLRGE